MSGLPNMQETSVAPAGRSVAAVPLPRIDAPALGLIITILIAGALALLKSTDPDYWWHLRTGQLIAQTHAVPTVDSYSFTANGKAWLAHEWLSELLFPRVVVPRTIESSSCCSASRAPNAGSRERSRQGSRRSGLRSGSRSRRTRSGRRSRRSIHGPAREAWRH